MLMWNKLNSLERRKNVMELYCDMKFCDLLMISEQMSCIIGNYVA